MRKTLVIAVALFVIAASSSFGAVYNLGASVTATGTASDGSVVAYNFGGNGYIFDTSTGLSTQLGTGIVTAGVAKMGSTIIVGGNGGGAAQQWRSDVGSWQALPLYQGVANWVVAATAASATEYWIGGQAGASPNEMSCYFKSATGATGDTSTPSGWSPNFRVIALADNGHQAGRGNVGGPTGQSGTARNTWATPFAGGANEGLNNLSGPANNTIEQQPLGISRDGSTVVGWTLGNQGVYWDMNLPNGGTPQAVPYLAGGYNASYAEAANGDGSLIFGWQRIGTNNDTRQGIVFNRLTNTTINFFDYALANGVDMGADGWVAVRSIQSVSADGKVIVGLGRRGDPVTGVTEGFVVVIPEPGSIVALATGLVGFFGLRRRFQF